MSIKAHMICHAAIDLQFEASWAGADGAWKLPSTRCHNDLAYHLPTPVHTSQYVRASVIRPFESTCRGPRLGDCASCGFKKLGTVPGPQNTLTSGSSLSWLS
jgi:hypothetical protein